AAVPRAHSRKRLQTALLLFRTAPHFPACPPAEPNPLRAVTSAAPVSSDRNTPGQAPPGQTSSLPLRMSADREPLPVPFPPCRPSKRQCCTAGPKTQGFPVCARRLAEG